MHDNKNVKITIGLQHENRRRILTNAGWIDSIPNRNCLASLWVGALSILASAGVQKLNGNGLHLKKRGRACQIETDGSGLFLGPKSGK